MVVRILISLVSLLSAGSPPTQQSAARAVGALAKDCSEEHLALVRGSLLLALGPLASLLGADALETQEWAQIALLHMAIHAESRAAIVALNVSSLSSSSASTVSL